MKLNTFESMNEWAEEQSSDDKRRRKSEGERRGGWRSQRRRPNGLGRHTEHTQSSPYACPIFHRPRRRKKRSLRTKEEEESEKCGDVVFNVPEKDISHTLVETLCSNEPTVSWFK